MKSMIITSLMIITILITSTMKHFANNYCTNDTVLSTVKLINLENYLVKITLIRNHNFKMNGMNKMKIIKKDHDNE